MCLVLKLLENAIQAPSKCSTAMLYGATVHVCCEERCRPGGPKGDKLVTGDARLLNCKDLDKNVNFSRLEERQR